MKNHIFRDRIGPNLPRYYSRIMMLVITCACLTVPAFAINDLFAVAKDIIIDLYNQIAGISTVLRPHRYRRWYAHTNKFYSETKRFWHGAAGTAPGFFCRVIRKERRGFCLSPRPGRNRRRLRRRDRLSLQAEGPHSGPAGIARPSCFH